MTQEITWVDTKLYHLGAIRWLSDYGIVPGIALIQLPIWMDIFLVCLNNPFKPSIG